MLEVNPGIFIKYFNGVEKEIPLSDFGHYFVEITRLKQSLDGKYAVLIGAKRINEAGNIFRLERGIYIFRIDVNIVT